MQRLQFPLFKAIHWGMQSLQCSDRSSPPLKGTLWELHSLQRSTCISPLRAREREIYIYVYIEREREREQSRSQTRLGKCSRYLRGHSGNCNRYSVVPGECSRYSVATAVPFLRDSFSGTCNRYSVATAFPIERGRS